MQSGFDFADIIDEVLARALGETSMASDVSSAKRSIYLTLETWHALQYNTWRVKSRDFAAVYNGQSLAVQLPYEVDDIITAAVINAANTDRDTVFVMNRLSEAEYASLTTRDTDGIPTAYLLRRSEPPLMLMNTRGRTGQTEMLRITFVARPDRFDRNAGNADDLPSRWLYPLILSAALDLATKNPERAGARLQVLSSAAPGAVQLALTNDRGRSSFKWRI